MTRRRIVALGLALVAAGLLVAWDDARRWSRIAGDLLRGSYDVRCRPPAPNVRRVFVPFEEERLAAWLHSRSSARGRAIVVHGASTLGHRHPTARLLVRAFAELDHDVLAIDLRGYGESPAPRGPPTPSTFDFGRDVAAALRWWNEQRPEAPPPLLAGHSLGAGAVLRADALGAPARGIVAAGAPFHEWLAEEEPGIVTRRARAQLGKMGLPATTARVRALEEALRAIDPARVPRRAPRLLLYASEGRNVERSRRYSERHPRDRVLLIEGVGHPLGARVDGPCELYRAQSLRQVRRGIEEWLRSGPGTPASPPARTRRGASQPLRERAGARSLGLHRGR